MRVGLSENTVGGRSGGVGREAGSGKRLRRGSQRFLPFGMLRVLYSKDSILRPIGLLIMHEISTAYASPVRCSTPIHRRIVIMGLCIFLMPNLSFP